MTTKEAVALLERYSNYDGMGIPNLAGCKEAMRVAVDALKEACPALAESEDERIRKAIVGLIEELQRSDKYFAGVELTDMLAYLEKQKDIEDRWIEDRGQCFWDGVEEGKMLAEKQEENPKSADSISSNCVSDAKCEVRDSKYGVFPEDVIVVARACEKLETHGYSELAHALKNVNLYTKEQKPEWSEEDEDNLRRVIRVLEDNDSDWKELSNWLKSLRPQPHWKPSEEQMGALEDAFRKNGSDEYRKTINSLYQDLKKL